MKKLFYLTPVSPTATLTAESPKATPKQVYTLATSAEDVVGTWVRSGVLYLRFDSDGTFRQAHAPDQLESQPYAISSYQFEGTELVTTGISVSGVPSCGKKVGRYEIRFLENGAIQIVTINDQCPPRAGDTQMCTNRSVSLVGSDTQIGEAGGMVQKN